MPTFNTEVYGDEDTIEISPSEFIDKCDESDIDELISELKSDGYVLDINIEDTPINQEYNSAVYRLFYLRSFLSIDDERTIIEIAKKY